MNKINQLTNEEEKIINKLKNLAKKITKHNKLYHGKDSPIIDDKEYDNLVKLNNILEKKYPHLILKNSPNKIIGSPVSKRFIKSVHKIPMLSLANAFNEKELNEFIESMSTAQFENLSAFFETMPKLQHMVEVKNPKTKKKGEVLIEGLQSFFV